MIGGRGWWAMVASGLVACVDQAPALPPMTGIADSGSTDASTGGGETRASASGTTGPASECGNGEVEPGEQCEGEEPGEATCESLGFTGSGVTCVDCRLDASPCGPPPGMVEVPAGVFEMGSEAFPDEGPIRYVQVDRFWMDEREVTVVEYAVCVDDGACSDPGTSSGCNWTIAGRATHPVNCVDWYQAQAYCDWAGGGTKRLPTEAEWEKAARGTDARTYPWGEMPEPSCSHVVMDDEAAGGEGCGSGSTMEVGSKPLGSSPYGVQDMAGNVYEWVSDWYAPSYDPRDTDNPTGPASSGSRVIRGGSWDLSGAVLLRGASRNNYGSAFTFDGVGIRCARTPPAAP